MPSTLKCHTVHLGYLWEERMPINSFSPDKVHLNDPINTSTLLKKKKKYSMLHLAASASAFKSKVEIARGVKFSGN